MARIKKALKIGLNCYCRQHKSMWNASQHEWRRIYKIWWLRRWFIWWKCPWATPASIVIASPEVLKDLRIAFEEGEKQSNDILEKWLFCKELSLITKNKTFNFTTIPSNVTKTCSNAAEMERNFWQGDLFSGEEWCNFPWTGISQKNFQIMSDYL